eukprot:jgi/Chrzof1/14312/Cz08g32180.t1
MNLDLSGFRKRVAEVNNGLHTSNLVPLVICGDEHLGWLKASFADQLAAHTDVFQLVEHENASRLQLHPRLKTVQDRTQAVAVVLEQLRTSGIITGWRNELYPVTAAFDKAPELLIERAAAPHFGIRAYGVHLNGYVRCTDGSMNLWVARRSPRKQTWPGKLDHIVAGGQPHGLSCRDNVVKECWEEAGVPEHLAAQARPTGFVSYVSFTDEGLKPDVLFCYDLELPADFMPQPQDGEVEQFMLWDLDKVAAVISNTQDYKPNCCLVVIDFLIRHGYIQPDQPGYVELVHRLRCGSPS